MVFVCLSVNTPRAKSAKRIRMNLIFKLQPYISIPPTIGTIQPNKHMKYNTFFNNWYIVPAVTHMRDNIQGTILLTSINVIYLSVISFSVGLLRSAYFYLLIFK